MRLGVVHESALRDVLPIADEIGKAEGFAVEHLQKARRGAAMLDIGLSLRARGGEKNARLRLDKSVQDRA